MPTYKCDNCNREFSSKQRLQTHLNRKVKCKGPTCISSSEEPKNNNSEIKAAPEPLENLTFDEQSEQPLKELQKKYVSYLEKTNNVRHEQPEEETVKTKPSTIKWVLLAGLVGMGALALNGNMKSQQVYHPCRRPLRVLRVC